MACAQSPAMAEFTAPLRKRFAAANAIFICGRGTGSLCDTSVSFPAGSFATCSPSTVPATRALLAATTTTNRHNARRGPFRRACHSARLSGTAAVVRVTIWIRPVADEHGEGGLATTGLNAPAQGLQVEASVAGCKSDSSAHRRDVAPESAAMHGDKAKNCELQPASKAQGRECFHSVFPSRAK